jgi:hypothetical protein
VAGRRARERTLAELKGGFAFDTIQTKRYAANSAWQWISILAHNDLKDSPCDSIEAAAAD